MRNDTTRPLLWLIAGGWATLLVSGVGGVYTAAAPRRTTSCRMENSPVYVVDAKRGEGWKDDWQVECRVLEDQGEKPPRVVLKQRLVLPQWATFGEAATAVEQFEKEHK